MLNMVFSSKRTDSLFNFASWSLIWTGIVLRLVEYFSNKSLWRDEAMLTLNILERSYSQLFKTLDYNQYAPPGFLIIEKTIVSVLGKSEFSLRLFPLICSIASIFVFYKLCNKFLSKGAILTALGFFAISTSLLYYSAETKQYSSDLLITLFLILMAQNILDKNLTVQKTFLYGIICSLFIWFSHSSIIVLCGCWGYLALDSLLKRDFRKILLISLSSILWIISFLSFYRIILFHTSTNQGLASLWQYYFLPFPSFSNESITVYKNLFNEFIRFFSLGTLAALSLFIGGYIFYRNQRKYFFIITSPILVTLILSVLHKYPLFERFILFLFPSFIFLISEGVEWVRQKVSGISPIIGIIFICLIFYKPCHFTIYDFKNPATQEEVKPVFKYLKEHLKAGDTVYVSEPLQYSFKYYSSKYGFCNDFSITPERKMLEEASCPKFNYKVYLGTSELDKSSIEKDFSHFIGSKRAWILFSEKRDIDLQYKSSALKHLDTIGIKTGSFLRTGVILYLYNLETISQ